LLLYLVERQGQVATQEELVIALWGEMNENSRQYLMMYISYLRKRIEEDPRAPRYVHTERGVGYWFGSTRDGTAPSGIAPKTE
jgi:DNA-binding response OmpR family regulator